MPQQGMDLPMLYESVITEIISICPGRDKFAHVFAGLGFWLIAALVLRKPLTSPLPLFAVAFLELLNECMDRIIKGNWQWPDTLGDAAATMFWPAVLFAALTFFPHLGTPRKAE